jgi:hypothetical protein
MRVTLSAAGPELILESLYDPNYGRTPDGERGIYRALPEHFLPARPTQIRRFEAAVHLPVPLFSQLRISDSQYRSIKALVILFVSFHKTCVHVDLRTSIALAR